MLALIGAGYTLQKFKRLHPTYDFFETHRDSLCATEDEIEGDLSFLSNANGLIFSLPPSKSALNLVKNLEFEKPAVLLSSIGVYAKDEPIVSEAGRIGESERSQLIYAIENEFLKMPKAVVLRLGGLFDENRHPVKYILKNNSKPNGDELVNFVHIDDVCEAIHIMLKYTPEHKVYNVVDINHPTKRDYYTKVAKTLAADSIIFSNNSYEQCKITSKRILEEFNIDADFLNKVR